MAAAESLVDVDPDVDLDGNGTESDPYQIGNASELQSMAGNLSANYTLTAAVDASNTSAWDDGAGFEPVGNATDPFTGSFNGSDQTISGMSINRSAEADVGLFGATNGAQIERVGLTDLDVDGNESVGGLIGNSTNNTEVATAYVTGAVVGNESVGGLVGHNVGSTVTTSYATSTITGNDSVGGLAGENADGGNITDSYAAGAVDGSSETGGLVGVNTGDDVVDSYWDQNETNQSTSAGGTNLTTAQMTGNNATLDANMAEFTFYEDWIPTEGYPILAWQYFGESTGDGTESDPYVVSNEYGLQALTADLDANYVLESDIDATDTEQWNDGDGFEPIGDGNQFSGSFEGDGYSISGLTIDRPNESDVGLFGDIGSGSRVSGVTITDANISGEENVGTLAGQNDGTISGVDISGNVSAEVLDALPGGGSNAVGGLVGESGGNVVESTAAVNVSVPNGSSIGGLIGRSVGEVVDSSARGDVSAPGSFQIGGLIGENAGEVIDSTASVNVSASGESEGNGFVGGLVGGNDGEVVGSRATGNIAASGAFGIGGLVGGHDGKVVDSIAVGNVSAPEAFGIGGLIGENMDGEVIDSTADVDVTAPTGRMVGGLVGGGGGEVVRSSASGAVTAFEGTMIGGLVGSSGGQINDSSATGDIDASEGSEVGGLVGISFEEVVNSVATGDVRGQTEVGGLVGFSESNITRSFATGNVEGNTTTGENVGGLVGDSNGPISDSSAFGDVTGNNRVGGFVGIIRDEVATSYSVGTVTGNENVGGFAGEISTSSIADSYWNTETSGTDTATGTGPETNITGLTTSELQGSQVTETTALAFNPVWVATDAYPIHAWRVDEYALSVGETTLDPGETTQATVSLTLSDGTSPTATAPAEYTSDTPDSVTIDDTGLVTAEEAGTAELTATASSFTDSASLSVTAPAPSSPSSPSGSSSDDDGGDEPEEEPVEEEPEAEPVEEEVESEPIEEETEPINETDEDDGNETVTETVEEREPRLTVSRVLAGGGVTAVGTYLFVLLFSRTELFAAAAPASVAKAAAAMPGAAGFLLAEPEQAAFVVGAVALAGKRADEDDDIDVIAGETATLDVTIENKGDVPGARVVTLSLDETEDSETVDLSAHTAHSAVLEYRTTPADAGKTLGFTIDCETDSTDFDITVGERTDDNHDSMSETTTPPDDARTDDTETTSGDTATPEEHSGEEELDADAAAEELDDGTRTGFLDRIWQKKGKILSYTAGIIIIYIGTTNLENNVFAGGLGIFLGVMALPIVRAQLPTSTRVLISRYGKVVVVIIAALFSGVLIDPAVVFETIEGLVP